MVAYGIIGGAVGSAIAITFGAWLQKRIIKREKKKKVSQGVVSYRPWYVALFLFLVAIGDLIGGLFIIWWIITDSFNFLFLICSIIVIIIGIILGCWSGSFLCARISISQERVIIDYAAKMPNRESKIHLRHQGRYHIDVCWNDIKELRRNQNFMQIVLYNGDCYMFPIGWCKEKAGATIARYKAIKPWY